MADDWPEPGPDGKIPCIVCKNGKRKNARTKELYTCNYCHGTLRRVPPPGYTPCNEKMILEDEDRLEQDFLGMRRRMQNEIRLITIEKALYRAGLLS